MAECNRLINNTPRATSAYMNALRYKYPDSIVNLRLGQMYQKSGRYGEAIKYYNDYLLAEPGSVLAFNGVTGVGGSGEMETVANPLYGEADG